MDEFEFKNTLLCGTTLFITLTSGFTALRAGAESGNLYLGVLGTSVCLAGLGLSYKIFKKVTENER